MRVVLTRSVIAATLLAIACGSDVSAPDADISEGLVAHYPLDGDANDATGGSPGVIVDATGVSDRSGAPSGALQLDGDGDHVVIAHTSSLDLANEFTIAAWIQPGSKLEPDLWYSIFEKSDPDRGGHSRYGLWLHGANPAACFEADDNSQQPCVEAETPLPADGWHHVAAVRSGRRLILYVDGTEVANGFVGLHDISRTPFDAFIGTDGYESQPVWLDAAIDDVRIYDRPLPAAEIATLSSL